jgi:NitT/TauT family transport system permease protein
MRTTNEPTQAQARQARELAGLDALDMPIRPRTARPARIWAGVWPKLAAAGILLVAWEGIVLTGWRPSYVLPGPVEVFQRLASDVTARDLPLAVAITMRRAAIGFGIALAVGIFLGLALVGSRRLRIAAASLITGLQTMPSIAWFPLAILIFGLSEPAILFVVVLGAAPAIANGLIAGVDTIPRSLLRVGQVLGARRFAKYGLVIMPAAVPSFVGGLKQGWAFAWRSLMAGELLVIIGAEPSIGARLQFARELSDAPGLLSMMLVILLIGIGIDGLLFGNLQALVARRWGLGVRS